MKNSKSFSNLNDKPNKPKSNKQLLIDKENIFGRKNKEISKPIQPTRVESNKKVSFMETPLDLNIKFIPSTTIETANQRPTLNMVKKPSNSTLIIKKNDNTEFSFPQTSQIIETIPIPENLIYSIDLLQQLKLKSPIKLMQSAGFVSIKLFSESKMTRSHSLCSVGKYKKKKNKESDLQLISHESNRYLGITKYIDLGLKKENSPEIIKEKAQRLLNRLVVANINQTITEINQISVPEDYLCTLLMERATTNSDNPEKNQFLALFLRFTIEYCNRFSRFEPKIREISYKTAFLLLDPSKRTHINCLQSISVWLAGLFNAGIGKKEQINSFLKNVLEVESKDRCIDVLRSCLMICGPNLDETFNIYFDFLKNNPSSLGYKRFFVEELFNFRDSNWNKQSFNKRYEENPLN